VSTGRFAPSTTGPAHPGTLLAALLGWLDARARDGRILLRLEDLDPERSKPEWSDAMLRDLDWLGLEFDDVTHQAARSGAHEAALDRLAAEGRLYPCACSRTRIRSESARAPDGGRRYPGTCRGRSLPGAGWRTSREPLRVVLPPGRITPEEESGIDLALDPAAAFGDPVVRRRDGVAAYHLASVVDDAEAGVDRVVRGRDLAPATALQVALQRCLGLPSPRYRHHLLLLEARGDKLAKLHGAVGAPELREHYDGPSLCGFLARACGLRAAADPVRPRQLVEDFSWGAVVETDVVVHWRPPKLELGS